MSAAGADPVPVRGAHLVVIAKAPVAGRVKTRLCPPYTPAQAAMLAEAALEDTLRAVAATPAAARTLVLDPGPTSPTLLPGDIAVIGQRGEGLDRRIAAALADAYARCAAPIVLIGMDTPQVTPDLLARAGRALSGGRAGAAYGPAADGGFWLLGLRRPDATLVEGVPMSVPETGAAQRARFVRAGLRVLDLPVLRDVDTAADADAVAALAPKGAFAARLATLRPHVEPEFATW
ncbi:MAG: DUF2064 domain-containing protein [Streptosporangiales bacterium]|nr:DUF2064 domain-containing protein [Streptosporangiales bacterium]